MTRASACCVLLLLCLLAWRSLHVTSQAPDMQFSNASEALTIFRPWGFQPGHQVEWARFLLTLNKHAPDIWFVPKARYLFDVSMAHAWDEEHGGIA